MLLVGEQKPQAGALIWLAASRSAFLRANLARAKGRSASWSARFPRQSPEFFDRLGHGGAQRPGQQDIGIRRELQTEAVRRLGFLELAFSKGNRRKISHSRGEHAHIHLGPEVLRGLEHFLRAANLAPLHALRQEGRAAGTADGP